MLKALVLASLRREQTQSPLLTDGGGVCGASLAARYVALLSVLFERLGRGDRLASWLLECVIVHLHLRL